MRRKTAREVLADSFRELALVKPVDKITVRDIIEDSGYSQATFYRQFKDKYDLIAWSYTRDLETILDQTKGDVQSWRQTLADAAAYYQQHKQYLANLLTHTTGYDSFIVNITAIHQRILLKTLERLSAPEPLDESIQIYSRLYCYGTVLFSCDWILGKYSLTEQELADIYENALPEQLARYIRKKNESVI